MPLTARATVWSPVTAKELVAVTVTTVVPASEALLVLTDRLTDGIGAGSLSVIKIFCVVVVPNVIPEEGLLIVSVAVSSPS